MLIRERRIGQPFAEARMSGRHEGDRMRGAIRQTRRRLQTAKMCRYHPHQRMWLHPAAVAAHCLHRRYIERIRVYGETVTDCAQELHCCRSVGRMP